jgi:OOP family OmpA-OmpF porin
MQPKSLIASTMFVSLLAAATHSFAAPASYSPGYWYDNEGQLIHDNESECVRTSEWTPQNAIPQCDPQLFRHRAAAAMKKPARGSTLLAEASDKTFPPRYATQLQNKNVTFYGDASFGFDKVTLTAMDRHNLDRLVARAKAMPEVATVHITGYADNVGTPAYNMKLSLRRAEAAQNYMVARGIDPKRIVIVGMGEADPAATNGTPAGRAQNRRVEIKVLTEQKVASSY